MKLYEVWSELDFPMANVATNNGVYSTIETAMEAYAEATLIVNDAGFEFEESPVVLREIEG